MNEKIEPIDEANEQSEEEVVKTLGVSRSKLRRMARKAELQKGHRVHPPGSSWKRRDGTTAKAGPRYGEPRKETVPAVSVDE